MDRQRQPFLKRVKALASSVLLPLVCLGNEEQRSSFALFNNGREPSQKRVGQKGLSVNHGIPRKEKSAVHELLLISKSENRTTNARHLKKGRIVGGTPADEGEYPFYAYPRGMMLCGATLIAPEILLTAAHCGGVWTSGALIGKTKR